MGRELECMLGEIAELKAFGHQELDLTQTSRIREAIRAFKPHIVLNAAAYTAVDKAEGEEPLARAINAEAPAALAEEAKKIDAALVHYSTDYVFDGRKNQAYTEEDATNPLSAYGRTKLEGEKAIQEVGGRYAIFRTEWVYGTRGKNFLVTILRLGSECEELRVVDDQVGAPTWSREIASATAQVISDEWQRAGRDLFAGRAGIYHMTAAGQTSWFEFASAIIEKARRSQKRAGWLGKATSERPIAVQRILPIAAKDYPTAARRPAYSVLSNARFERTFGVKLPDWRIQLESALSLEESE